MSWRPHHSGDISFSYVKTLTSLVIWGGVGGGGGVRASIIRLGPSWFTSTLSFILIYMSYMLSNLIRTLWVKIKHMNKINKISFFRGHVEPLHQIQGDRGTKMPANANLITVVEAYEQQGKSIENQIFIYGTKCDFFFFISLVICGALDWAYLAF